ncbi:unnamed protein product, partial [Allacma fusca]
ESLQKQDRSRACLHLIRSFEDLQEQVTRLSSTIQMVQDHGQRSDDRLSKLESSVSCIQGSVMDLTEKCKLLETKLKLHGQREERLKMLTVALERFFDESTVTVAESEREMSTPRRKSKRKRNLDKLMATEKFRPDLDFPERVKIPVKSVVSVPPLVVHKTGENPSIPNIAHKIVTPQTGVTEGEKLFGNDHRALTMVETVKHISETARSSFEKVGGRNLANYKKLLPELYKTDVRIYCHRLKLPQTPISLKQIGHIGSEPATEPSEIKLVEEIEIVDNDGLETVPEVLRDAENSASENISDVESVQSILESNHDEIDPAHITSEANLGSESSHMNSTDSDFEVVMEDSCSFKDTSSGVTNLSEIETAEGTESWSSSLSESNYSSASSRSSNIVNEPCDICDKVIKYSYNLVRHMNKHIESKDFRCKLCHKNFVSKTKLLDHRSNHCLKPFSCEQCPKVFGKIYHLNAHMETHQGSDSISCQYCGKTFSQNSNLKQHLLTHKGDRPFECNICESSFALKKTLDQHLKLHGVARGKKFSCEYCDSKFFSNEVCKEHMNRHQKGDTNHTDAKLLHCIHCDKKFKHSKSLIKHLNFDHAGDKNLDCQVCGKSLLTIDGFNRHLRSHGFDEHE